MPENIACRGKDRFSVYAAYVNAAEKPEISDMWKHYAAELAFELFRKDTEAGYTFLQEAELCSADPVELVRRTAEKLDPRDCPEHSFALLKDNLPALIKRIRIAQVKVCFPIIEEERFAYISNQYERIETVLGAEYWDSEEETYRTLWNYSLNRPAEDPYELDIRTVSRLSSVSKRITMLNTFNIMPFYSMYPRERERLTLLADCKDILESGKLCSAELLDKLFAAHGDFMDKWSVETQARIEEQKEIRATHARYTAG